MLIADDFATERVGVDKLVTRHISLIERLRKAQVRQDDVSRPGMPSVYGPRRRTDWFPTNFKV